jgi:DNA-binding CsgD family transcriptional regulator
LARDRENRDAEGIAASLVNLGLAALITGELGRAAKLLDESLAVLREVHNKHTLVECLEAMAAVAGARGQTRRAARLLGVTQAVRENIGAPLPPNERALLEPYLAHARLDEAAWDAAYAQGRAMGLDEAVEYALLAEEPAPSAHPPPEQPSVGRQVTALTRREKEVAKLVARGLTNRQMAQELSISERTVENHIGKILKKLGFSSRARIATWVAKR